ncbi:MAG: ComEC/Rec2 family competence protein [Candidatus Levybacteria bacterium]|nr:ComEC/Rec2 family competence protein [Candidatus Levybacteria bacterium]
MRLLIIGVTLLGLLFFRFFLFYDKSDLPQDGEQISFRSTLFSEPKIYQSYQRIEVDYQGKEKIFVFANIYPEYHYGDSLSISGRVKYRLLNNGDNFISMSYPKIEAVKTSENYFLAFISLVRQKIISLFQKSMPVKSASLLLGIVFGIKETMPKDFSDNLKNAGVMHVIAASGMNVTLVGGFISSIMVFFVKRRLALFISIFGILFYAILSGLESSIIRAAIMGILTFSAQILGRQRLAAFALLLTGYGMLFFRPNLLFDIGFQLSFVSTAGILYIKPIIEINKGIKMILNKSIIGEEAVTTISAQAAALPILIANFGTYSLWSVLVNILVIWTIPILMILGGVGAILGILIIPIGKIFLFFSVPLLIYFEMVVNFFAEQGVVKIESISWPFILGYYCILFSLIYMIKRNSE